AAAREALFRGAPAAAAELVELALRLGEPDTEAHRRRTVDVADYLSADGERVRARAVLQGISSWAGWPPGLQARALARLCQLVCDAEHPASAIEFLERDSASRAASKLAPPSKADSATASPRLMPRRQSSMQTQRSR